MSKPKIGQLLAASGSSLTFNNVMSAANSLYGYIGVGLDERDWNTILASGNALQASYTALIDMYQDADFLVRNAYYISAKGYSYNQVVYTYRQIETDLGFKMPAGWADGTGLANVWAKSFDSLRGDAASDYQASLIIPTLTVSATSTGFSVTSSHDGTLEMVGVGALGAVVAGANNLSVQGAVSTGTLRVLLDGRPSTETSQTFTLGTNGADAINTTGAGAQVDYVLGGNGVDTISTGDGADWIVAGAGADVINAGAGADSVFGGDDDDTIVADENDLEINGGAGTDTLRVLANFDDQYVLQVRSIEVVNLEADGLSFELSSLNFINATINGFAGGASTIVGSNGDETINGGSGDDTLSGGSGDDIIDGKGGDDNYGNSVGDDTFLVTAGTGNTIGVVGTGDIIKVSAGAAVDITTTTSFVATADTQNLGGQASDFDIEENQGDKTIDMSSATVTTAATDGFKIVSSGINGSTLIGSSGYDTIISEHTFGTATLTGNNGNDTFNGGDGKDVMTGGSGVDTYKFLVTDTSTTLANADVITDFRNDRAAEDIIDFTNLVHTDLRGDGDQYQLINPAVAYVLGANTGMVVFFSALTDLNPATALAAANTIVGWNANDEIYFLAMSGLDAAIYNIKELTGDTTFDSAVVVVKLEDIGVKHFSPDNFDGFSGPVPA